MLVGTKSAQVGCVDRGVVFKIRTKARFALHVFLRFLIIKMKEQTINHVLEQKVEMLWTFHLKNRQTRFLKGDICFRP